MGGDDDRPSISLATIKSNSTSAMSWLWNNPMIRKISTLRAGYHTCASHFFCSHCTPSSHIARALRIYALHIACARGTYAPHIARTSCTLHGWKRRMARKASECRKNKNSMKQPKCIRPQQKIFQLRAFLRWPRKVYRF